MDVTWVFGIQVSIGPGGFAFLWTKRSREPSSVQALGVRDALGHQTIRRIRRAHQGVPDQGQRDGADRRVRCHQVRALPPRPLLLTPSPLTVWTILRKAVGRTRGPRCAHGRLRFPCVFVRSVQLRVQAGPRAPGGHA